MKASGYPPTQRRPFTVSRIGAAPTWPAAPRAALRPSAPPMFGDTNVALAPAQARPPQRQRERLPSLLAPAQGLCRPPTRPVRAGCAPVRGERNRNPVPTHHIDDEREHTERRSATESRLRTPHSKSQKSMAEGEGFEPPRGLRPGGFQVHCLTS